jgi:hypothetical protein
MSETTATVATPEVKKTTKVRKAKPVKAEKATKPSRNGTLTGNEVKVLSTLNKNSKPLTRTELSVKTGINKGWSRLLGAATKGTGDGLENRKLVKCSLPGEGEGRGLVYTITASGKAALVKAKE